jgi:hypothetical protein
MLHKTVSLAEPQGFKYLRGQLRDSDGWQLELSANEHGRVYGFLLQSIFYVIWFDQNHNIYN